MSGLPSIDPVQDLDDDWTQRHNALRRQVEAAVRIAEQHARSGTLDYDERTRWRRFAAQLQEALRA